MDYIDSLRIEGVDYGISQLRDEGVNKVTTLSNIPVDKRMIYATLSKNVTEISINEGLIEGDSIIIICNPTIDIKILMSGTGIVSITEDNPVIDAKKGELFLITIAKKGTDYIIDTTGKIINSLGFVEKANPGDILIWNSLYSTLGFITYDQLCTITEDDKSLYTPIGICAIPSEHNVYGNGKAGVIGFNEIEKKWGDSSVDTGLKNYINSPTVDSVSGEFIDLVSVDTNNILPSEVFHDIVSSDGITGYIDPVKHTDLFGTTRYYLFVPSPYNNDGSRNMTYCISTGHNVLSDFFGKDNTETLSSLGSDYEAAQWCSSYLVDTPNSSPITGWYLPSAGEMGYVNNRVVSINNSIEKVSEIFNLSLDKISVADISNIESTKTYWTSTEVSDVNVVIFLIGRIMDFAPYSGKEETYWVRPFLQVDPRQELPETIKVTFNVSPEDMIIRYSINTEDYDQVLEYNDEGYLVLGTGRLGFNTLE